MEGWNGEAEDEVPAVMVCLSEIPNQSSIQINQSINQSITRSCELCPPRRIMKKSKQYTISLLLGDERPQFQV